jgi:hypothetical protein
MLGQEGWITDQISPDHSHFTNGTPPLDPFIPPTAAIELKSVFTDMINAMDIQCFPNPFRRKVQIRLQNGGTEFKGAEVKVFNVNGRMVEQFRPMAGAALEWKTEGLPAGVYIVKAAVKGRNVKKKIVLIK